MGTPYGFFPRDVPGFEHGFPVVWVPTLNSKAAVQLVEYLRDGIYLDAQTRVLRLHLLVLNRDADGFG